MSVTELTPTQLDALADCIGFLVELARSQKNTPADGEVIEATPKAEAEAKAVKPLQRENNNTSLKIQEINEVRE